jgi:L-ascorbate metabolism protein UlaG (beta-lactamase superfamily)
MRTRPSAVALLLALLPCAAGCDEPLQHRDDAAPVPAAPPSMVAGSSRVTDRFPTASGELGVVPLEHATLLLLWQGRAIYVDPTSPAVDDATLPPADLVLVTDFHYDHLDPFALTQVKKPETIVMLSPSARARADRDALLRGGDQRALPRGLTVTEVPAYSVQRGAGPGALYHDDGKAVGFLVDFAGTRVYVSGDTECTPEMRTLAGVDVAFVSLNVPYAMTAEEATACVAAFRPRVVFPYASRHAFPATLDRGSLGPGIEVRRREWYPRAEDARQKAYWALTRGMWGLADDELDKAKQLDPAGDEDWRVQMTRKRLREYENPWPW